MSAIEVSAYRPDHREAIVEMMAALQDFERSLSADRTDGRPMAAAHLDYLLQLCEAHSGQAYVAGEGQEVVGFVVVFVETEDEEDEHLLPEFKRFGWVSDLYVRESHRARGAATMLMQRAERHCADLGLRRLKLSALHGNGPARRFYEGIGYRPYEVVFCKDL